MLYEVYEYIINIDKILTLQELEDKFNENSDKMFSKKLKQLLKALERDSIIFYDGKQDKYLPCMPNGNGWCKFTEKECNPYECENFNDYRNKCISANVMIEIEILDNVKDYDEIPENILIDFYCSKSSDELIEKIKKFNKNKDIK